MEKNGQENKRKAKEKLNSFFFGGIGEKGTCFIYKFQNT